MRILHLSNDYSGSTVYMNLISSLDNLDISQTIYNPIRDVQLVGKNKVILKNKDSSIIYSPILNYTTDRLFFKSKIKKIVKDVITQIELSSVDCIHAHTWYSDGAVAYELSKRLDIPYIVTIRNTDLNLFYKYMLHLRPYALKILLSAQKIIFLSDVYVCRFRKTNFFLKNKDSFEKKIVTIYNGIENFWIDNAFSEFAAYKKDDTFKVLYIGKFNSGKNVTRLIKSIKILNQGSSKYTLTLVGGNGDKEKEILKYVNNFDFVEYLGCIYEKDKLKELFRLHDLFAMPSKAETFGLVYIEALSQGVPILNTINEGIYGMYEGVGESVIHNKISSICNGIEKIRDNYELYNFRPEEVVIKHRWDYIARDFLLLYNKAINIHKLNEEN